MLLELINALLVKLALISTLSLLERVSLVFLIVFLVLMEQAVTVADLVLFTIQHLKNASNVFQDVHLANTTESMNALNAIPVMNPQCQVL